MVRCSQQLKNYIVNHNDDVLTDLKRLLQQPSISPQNVGIPECADLVAQLFEESTGQKAEVVKTERNPIVYGEYNCEAEKTLLCYFMYDTQPYDDADQWSSPPMGANIVPMELECGEVHSIVNRGAYNTKGPLVVFLNAVKAMRNVNGQLPVNLLLLAEGEEELGSPSLPDFLQQRKEELSRASAIFFPFFLQDEKGDLDLYLGTKGILYFELECSGEAWGRGPQEFDIHGSNMAWIDNPAWRMVNVLRTLSDGKRALIEGFYKDVADPTSQEQDLIRQLAVTFDPLPTKKGNRVREFAIPEDDREALLQAYLYNSTLNINGIEGGYTGQGSKTVIPHKVTAKMDIRLVPNQTREKMLAQLRTHLNQHGYSDIRVTVLNQGYPWSRVSVREPIVQAAINTCRAFDVSPRIWPRLAGSAPFSLFQGILNRPFIFGMMGHGNRAHSPDEYIVVEGNEKIAGIVETQISYIDFLTRYQEG